MHRDVLSVFCVVTLLIFCLPYPVEAQQVGAWRIGMGQGVIEHTVKNGPGNELTVNCAEAALRGASISVSIKGKSPTRLTDIRFFVDEEDYSFRVDGGGRVDTDSRVDSDNFLALWQSLKRARSLRVVFANGDTSTFSTRGAAATFKGRPCKTGFQM